MITLGTLLKRLEAEDLYNPELRIVLSADDADGRMLEVDIEDFDVLAGRRLILFPAYTLREV